MESGIDYYYIYRDGVEVGTSTSAFYSDTGLLEQTSYTYKVSAVNGEGLESNQSAPFVGYPFLLLGDVNLDGVVNGLDVDPFVSHVVWGPYLAEADMDQDGHLGGLDVHLFIDAVIGGGVTAVPEPSTITLLALAGLVAGGWVAKGRPARTGA
jgi:hypothetical protein